MVESSNPPPVIDVRNLGKCYQIFARPEDRLKQILLQRFGKNYCREFWALRDVTFSVAPGEIVGIIGKNGSGKSTLLQVIAGVLEPTEGSVAVRGTIGALLELGSGFNPEFTGRENAELTGTIMGLSTEEVGATIDDIAAFADIGQFFDQPVKTYSSGMFVRLAFAVQTCRRPDLLIVDEALSVGDIYFTQKCFARVNEMVAQGTSVLFVSHDVGAVSRLCNHAICLRDGHIVAQGEPERVIGMYLAQERRSEIRAAAPPASTPPAEAETSPATEAPAANRENGIPCDSDPQLPGFYPVSGDYLRHGDGAMRILGFTLSSSDEIGPLSHIRAGTKVRLGIVIECHGDDLRPNVGFQVRDRHGALATGTNTHLLSIPTSAMRNGERFQAVFELDLMVGTGEYTLSLAVVSLDETERVFDWIDQAYHFSVVVHDPKSCDGLTFCPASGEFVRDGVCP